MDKIKSLKLILIAIFCVSLISQCKKDDNDTQQNQPVKYTVDYQCNITGGYQTDLKIEYYEPNSVKKEVINPVLPWQMEFTNFNEGDSVLLHIHYLIPATTDTITYGYDWSVTATGGGNLPIDQHGNQNTTGLVPNTITYDLGWDGPILYLNSIVAGWS